MSGLLHPFTAEIFAQRGAREPNDMRRMRGEKSAGIGRFRPADFSSSGAWQPRGREVLSHDIDSSSLGCLSASSKNSIFIPNLLLRVLIKSGVQVTCADHVSYRTGSFG